MFIVATATFRTLYTLIVPDHDRSKLIHFGGTENPTHVWLSHQMTEAFPRETAARHLLRDRDASYGPVFRTRLQGMGVEEVVIAPRSPRTEGGVKKYRSRPRASNGLMTVY
jgi:hypothetical protein